LNSRKGINVIAGLAIFRCLRWSPNPGQVAKREFRP
jgi:hypothetical protein